MEFNYKANTPHKLVLRSFTTSLNWGSRRQVYMGGSPWRSWKFSVGCANRKILWVWVTIAFDSMKKMCMMFYHILSPVFMAFVDEVFQVTWKMRIQGVELSTRDSDKGPIRLKLVKQANAQQPLFFTLECFVCAGTLQISMWKDQSSLLSVLHFT